MTLPGSWELAPSADQRFELAQQRVCLNRQEWTLEAAEPLAPGPGQFTVVLWSEVPQVLGDAQVSLDLAALQPPDKSSGTSPAVGATWQPPSWEWFHHNSRDFGWRVTRAGRPGTNVDVIVEKRTAPTAPGSGTRAPAGIGLRHPRWQSFSAPMGKSRSTRPPSRWQKLSLLGHRVRPSGSPASGDGSIVIGSGTTESGKFLRRRTCAGCQGRPSSSVDGSCCSKMSRRSRSTVCRARAPETT